jgi:NADPH-dependent glutamate synthase beta subunit-like oxidoreductase/ferredoxin
MARSLAVVPTDTRDPRHYHKVVDCQWACPAHTNVPEYIRLIAQGRYSDAYLVNRRSNVFPGVLGRTCDRPCEPACRRSRVEDKPVAICRLKRVAADLRDDVQDRLPTAPVKKNGKRIAAIGAGPASLTVANDLMPLGYQVTIFEKLPVPGGLMRSNIPSFRLPEQVLNEEIDYITRMGVDMRYGTPVDSLRRLLDDGGFDAVFVGSGAPKGKDLELPGRKEAAANIHIGIDWLHSVAFGHTDKIGGRVLIIGVGNTAMDCCRTSRRLGGHDVKVMARRPRAFFKASPWELEDAEEEQVDILVNHVPKAFVVEGGKLTGMKFDRVEYKPDERGQPAQAIVLEEIFLPADDVILAIGQENAFPFIERDLGLEFDKWGNPKVDKQTYMSTRPGVFFGGDAAWGPLNIIWAVEHGHQAAISIDAHCQGRSLTERPPMGMNLQSTKMGIHEWSYKNDYNPVGRQKMKHVELERRFKELSLEVELGFDAAQTAREVERCLNCDIQTAFTDKLCIECDACIDVCPVLCLTIAPAAEESTLRQRLSAPATNQAQDLFLSGPLAQTGRIMIKDEDMCVHCGLCAERCPTAAWDMQKFELVVPYAGKKAEGASQ